MKIAFYFDYDKYNSDQAPAILQFVECLRKSFYVEFFTNETELLDSIDSFDLLAISVFTTHEIYNAIKSSIKAKIKNENIIVAMGGQGIYGYENELIYVPSIDIVVRGEGEIIFPKILKELKPIDGGKIYRNVDINLNINPKDAELFKYDFISPITDENAEQIFDKGFFRRYKNYELEIPFKNAMIKSRSKRIHRADIKKFYIRNKKKYEELSYEEYLKLIHNHPNNEELNSLMNDYPWDIIRKKGYKGLSIYSQRGCNWYKCSYCAIVTKPGRRLSVRNVVKILENAKRNGIRYVTFEDDQFIQDEDYVRRLCEEIINRNLNKIAFGAMIRVDSIKDYSLLRIMREANFIKLQIGIESFIEEKIRYFRKYYENREHEYISMAKDLIFKILEHEIMPGIFIILTRPKDKFVLIEVAEEIKRLLEIFVECKRRYNIIPDISINDILFAYPNSYLIRFERYKKISFPIYIYKVDERYRVKMLEIPFIFDFKNFSHEIFINILSNIVRNKGLNPGIAGERIEHISEIIEALEKMLSFNHDLRYILEYTLYKLYKMGRIREEFEKIGFKFDRNMNDFSIYNYLRKIFGKIDSRMLLNKLIGFDNMKRYI